ncbi:MAG: hypothetical protein ABI880_12305 [Acidobacteriota bacterium]
MSTRFTCDDTDTLVAYIYDDLEPARHDAVARHLVECTRCRHEIAALGGVRTALSHWTPPVPSLRFTVGEATVTDNVIRPSVPAWQAVPVWAQVAAATLAVAVGASIANVQVRHDAAGWTVSTGWMAPVTTAAARPAADESWRPALAALEQSMRSEMSGRVVANVAMTTPAASAAHVAVDGDTIARMRSLIEASERKQQRELALRVTQLGRDMDLQRRADLVRVEQGIGQLESRAGAEVARQRQMLDMVVRASLRPPQ